MIHKESWYKEAEKLLFKNDRFVIKETDSGKSYIEGAPSGAVAVLPFDGDYYLTYYEPMEIRGDGLYPWCIFGGVGDHGTPSQAAVGELLEEGGYEVTEDDLIPLGTLWASKDRTGDIHLFGVDLSGVPCQDPEGDGSEEEEIAKPKWVSRKVLLDSPCPYLHTMLCRLEDLDGRRSK